MCIRDSSRIRIRGWVTLRPALRRSCDSMGNSAWASDTSCVQAGTPFAASGNDGPVYHRPLFTTPRIRMRKFLLVVALAASTAGCGILYKQPIYQGNLIEKASADQLKVGMSKQQVQA